MIARGCFIVSILVCAAVYVAGCGGGSGGGGGSQAVTVVINPNTLAPFSTTIRVNDSVTWVNSDAEAHFVISGALQMVPVNERTTRRILINQNNSFTPTALDANFGDTIEWHNNRSTTYALNIVDQLNTVIAQLGFAQGQIVPYNAFPAAGVYLYEQADIPRITGVLRLFGVTTPDLQFQSQILPTGGMFQRQFPVAGTYNYYITNSTNQRLAFLSGTITVQ